jgi:hypothetical protein
MTAFKTISEKLTACANIAMRCVSCPSSLIASWTISAFVVATSNSSCAVPSRARLRPDRKVLTRRDAPVNLRWPLRTTSGARQGCVKGSLRDATVTGRVQSSSTCRARGPSRECAASRSEPITKLVLVGSNSRVRVSLALTDGSPRSRGRRSRSASSPRSKARGPCWQRHR